MKVWLTNLDDILRGSATQTHRLSGRSLDIPIGGITIVILGLGVIFGLCMGSFALFRGFESADPQVYRDAWQQIIASSVKVPALFALTLVITFPSLYVFNALIGSQLGLRAVLKLLIAALGVNLAVLASLGPIVAFFSASTPNYPFILLLNVTVFAVAGALSLIFLFQTLNRLSLVSENFQSTKCSRDPRQSESSKTQKSIAQASIYEPSLAPGREPQEPSNRPPTPKPPQAVHGPNQPNQPNVAGPLDRTSSNSARQNIKVIFGCWVIVYGLVGAQMGWVLRPFVGSPGSPFEWFRERDANFFQGVLRSLENLFS